MFPATPCILLSRSFSVSVTFSTKLGETPTPATPACNTTRGQCDVASQLMGGGRHTGILWLAWMIPRAAWLSWAANLKTGQPGIVKLIISQLQHLSSSPPLLLGSCLKMESSIVGNVWYWTCDVPSSPGVSLPSITAVNTNLKCVRESHYTDLSHLVRSCEFGKIFLFYYQS